MGLVSVLQNAKMRADRTQEDPDLRGAETVENLNFFRENFFERRLLHSKNILTVGWLTEASSVSSLSYLHNFVFHSPHPVGSTGGIHTI